jgi:DNA-binding response OmpR family regulator
MRKPRRESAGGGAMKARILVIEDDPGIADSVAYTLRQEGFDAAVARDGATGLDEAARRTPDLVILDLMLPGMDGFDVFRALRKHSDCPVIMLTARVAESDRVAGIELGADDYVTKPFYMRELVARARMVLRRVAAPALEEDAPLVVRDLRVDPARREVWVGDRPVELTPQEFELLACLARSPGRALTREVILERAWGESDYIDPRTVDVHVRWLRQKIEDQPEAPARILTVRGVGYKLAE